MGWVSTPRPGRFTPGNDPLPIVQGAGRAPGLVWTGAENLAATEIRSPDLPVPVGYAIPPTHTVHIPDEVRAWERNNETLLRQEQTSSLRICS